MREILWVVFARLNRGSQTPNVEYRCSYKWKKPGPEEICINPYELGVRIKKLNIHKQGLENSSIQIIYTEGKNLLEERALNPEEWEMMMRGIERTD